MNAQPTRRRRLSDYLSANSPKPPLVLLGLGILFFICFPLLDTRTADQTGFFDAPLLILLLLVAYALVIAAGIAALIDLRKDPIVTPRGTWALRLAILSCLLMPVVALAAVLADALFGSGLRDGFGDWALPVWLLITLVAGLLGAIAHESRRRGLLLVPLMVGAFATFALIWEITVSH